MPIPPALTNTATLAVLWVSLRVCAPVVAMVCAPSLLCAGLVGAVIGIFAPRRVPAPAPLTLTGRRRTKRLLRHLRTRRKQPATAGTPTPPHGRPLREKPFMQRELSDKPPRPPARGRGVAASCSDHWVHFGEQTRVNSCERRRTAGMQAASLSVTSTNVQFTEGRALPSLPGWCRACARSRRSTSTHWSECGTWGEYTTARRMSEIAWAFRSGALQCVVGIGHRLRGRTERRCGASDGAEGHVRPERSSGNDPAGVGALGCIGSGRCRYIQPCFPLKLELTPPELKS